MTRNKKGRKERGHSKPKEREEREGRKTKEDSTTKVKT